MGAPSPPKLILTGPQIALAAATYANLENAFWSGVSAGGIPNVDLPGVKGYNDDQKMGGSAAGANRITMKTAILLGLEAYIAALADATPAPAYASSNSPSDTNSGGYAAISGATLTVNQVSASQKVIVSFNMSAYAAGGPAVGAGKRIDGGTAQTAFPFSIGYFPAVPTAVPPLPAFTMPAGFSFTWLVTGPATTGPQTATIEWALTSGSGTLTMDSTCHWDLLAQ
jgi:hypothetical protein